MPEVSSPAINPGNAGTAITGVAVGTPVAVLATWLFGTMGFEVPAEVTAAIAGLITALVVWLGPKPKTE